MTDSQCARLLARLERGPINPMQALVELGIFRLAARINDLRKMGYRIAREMVTVLNRYGESCRVAQYRLEVAA